MVYIMSVQIRVENAEGALVDGYSFANGSGLGIPGITGITGIPGIPGAPSGRLNFTATNNQGQVIGRYQYPKNSVLPLFDFGEWLKTGLKGVIDGDDSDEWFKTGLKGVIDGDDSVEYKKSAVIDKSVEFTYFGKKPTLYTLITDKKTFAVIGIVHDSEKNVKLYFGYSKGMQDYILLLYLPVQKLILTIIKPSGSSGRSYKFISSGSMGNFYLKGMEVFADMRNNEAGGGKFVISSELGSVIYSLNGFYEATEALVKRGLP